MNELEKACKSVVQDENPPIGHTIVVGKNSNMSFCKYCGHEYEAVPGQNFCESCGRDLRREVEAEEPKPNVPSIQKVSVGPAAENRPIAGIAVAAIFGTIGLLWSFASLFHCFYGNPTSMEAALYQNFPGLQAVTCFGGALGVTGNAVIILGALLAFWKHQNAAKTIRITCYSMMASSLILIIVTFFIVIRSDAWPTLDPSTKGGLIGGIIGGMVGAVFQWGLLLFLFKKDKTKQNLPPAINCESHRIPQKDSNQPPDKIRYECPQCNLIMSGSTSEIGKMLICPGCKASFFPVPR